VKACRIRGPHSSRAKWPNQTDQDFSLSGVIVFWIHATVPPAARVLCVGLNYPDHVAEGTFQRPAHPAVFGRWTRSLTVSGTPAPVPAVVGLLRPAAVCFHALGRRRGRTDTLVGGVEQPCVLAAPRRHGHSHSMVPGGFDVTSSATRFTPSTSLMMREAMRSTRS